MKILQYLDTAALSVCFTRQKVIISFIAEMRF